MRWRLAIGVLISMGLLKPALGDFKGINDLSVLVEHLPAVASDVGLTIQGLQRAVEEKLKLGGVLISQPKFPYLYLNVMVLKTITNGYTFKCSLALKEKGILARNPKKWSPVSTWQRDVLGLAAANELPKSIQECAETLTGNFLVEF